MSEIKTDNQITLYGALKHIAVKILAPGAVNGPHDMINLGHKDGVTRDQKRQIVDYINNGLPHDVAVAVSLFVGANGQARYDQYGSLADTASIQNAVNVAEKLSDENDKRLLYGFIMRSAERVLDSNSLGKVGLNYARLSKTSHAYNWLLMNAMSRGTDFLSNDQIKEALQEYYEVKKQEIFAEMGKDMPNMKQIKSNMLNNVHLFQDDEIKKMARVLSDDLVQMVEKASRVQTREEFVHNAIEIPLLEKEKQNAELPSQNEQQNAQIDQLQAQIAQMSREIETLNEQVAAVTTERDAARNENSTLKMRLAKLKMLFKDFSKNFSGLSKTSNIQDKADAVLAQFDRDDR